MLYKTYFLLKEEELLESEATSSYFLKLKRKLDSNENL